NLPNARRKGWAASLLHAAAHSSPPPCESAGRLRTFDLDVVPGHTAYLRESVGPSRRVNREAEGDNGAQQRRRDRAVRAPKAGAVPRGRLRAAKRGPDK